jgi:hypothetical protein
LLLWLAGNGLRLTILAVPPVIPLIHDELDLSATQISILTGLPSMLFAFAAVPGSLLIARLGCVSQSFGRRRSPTTKSKVIGVALAEEREFELGEVMTDEAAHPADEGHLSGTWLIRHVVLFQRWLTSGRQSLFEHMKCQGGALIRK